MELLTLSDQTVTINGKTIPKIYGGFGAGQPAILAKQIAELHGRELFKINQLINSNLDWYEEGIDIINLAILPEYSQIYRNFLLNFYSNDALNASKYIYLLSQQGYALLCRDLKSDLAKQTYKEMIRKYFKMEEIQQHLNITIDQTSGKLSKLLVEITNQFELCKKMAETAGLTGNHAILSASMAVKHFLGYDPLELLGQKQLTCEVQEIHLAPTAIGKKFELSAQKVNKLLEKVGLQESFRDAKDKKCWKPTEKGKAFSVLKDTNKKHKDGRAVQQLMWLESVIPILKESENQSEFIF